MILWPKMGPRTHRSSARQNWLVCKKWPLPLKSVRRELRRPMRPIQLWPIHGLRLKLYPEALGYYDRALAIAPNDFEVAYAKLYCLLAAKKNRAAVNYAEEILAKTNLSGRPASAKIFAGYLAALVRSNQSTSPKYYQTFTKFLAEQPDSVYAHSYAAHYYNQTKDNKKVQKHVNTIIELAETGDGENSVKGYSADIVEVIAAAALGAIAQRNKKFAWRCIAHLMNSDLAHATVLQLREAASAAFPRPQTPEMNYTL